MKDGSSCGCIFTVSDLTVNSAIRLAVFLHPEMLKADGMILFSPAPSAETV